MNSAVTTWARSADFQRAFVAMRYFWGARGLELQSGLEGVGVSSAAADTLSGLSHVERRERAAKLGAELGRLASELDRRSLWR
jgi:hypothetical protein